MENYYRLLELSPHSSHLLKLAHLAYVVSWKSDKCVSDRLYQWGKFIGDFRPFKITLVRIANICVILAVMNLNKTNLFHQLLQTNVVGYVSAFEVLLLLPKGGSAPSSGRIPKFPWVQCLSWNMNQLFQSLWLGSSLKFELPSTGPGISGNHSAVWDTDYLMTSSKDSKCDVCQEPIKAFILPTTLMWSLKLASFGKQVLIKDNKSGKRGIGVACSERCTLLAQKIFSPLIEELAAKGPACDIEDLIAIRSRSDVIAYSNLRSFFESHINDSLKHLAFANPDDAIKHQEPKLSDTLAAAAAASDIKLKDENLFLSKLGVELIPEANVSHLYRQEPLSYKALTDHRLAHFSQVGCPLLSFYPPGELGMTYPTPQTLTLIWKREWGQVNEFASKDHRWSIECLVTQTDACSPYEYNPFSLLCCKGSTDFLVFPINYSFCLPLGLSPQTGVLKVKNKLDHDDLRRTIQQFGSLLFVREVCVFRSDLLGVYMLTFLSVFCFCSA